MLHTRISGLRIMLLGLLGGHIGLALAFAFGGPDRFGGPAFSTALKVLPQHGWAVVFTVLAVTLAAAWPRRRCLVVQLAGSMFLYLFWSACFTLSALHYDTAALTGPIVWLVVAVCNAACASTIYGPLPSHRQRR